MEECKSDTLSSLLRVFLFSYHYGILPRYRLRLSLSGSILYYIRLTALFTWNGACVVTFLMIMTNFAFLHDITFHILVLYDVYYIFSTYIYIIQFILTTLMYFRRTVLLSFKKNIPFFPFITSMIYIDYLIREAFFYVDLTTNFSLYRRCMLCPLFLIS